MAGAKNIEALSLAFTLGVGMGVGLSGSVPWEVSAAALALSGVPLLLAGRCAPPGELPLLVVSFLLAGLFSGLAGSIPWAGAPSMPERWARAACERLKEVIARTPFPSEGTAPLLTALFTGDRSGLSRATVSAFRDSGASHILALSGLHLGILYAILDRITRAAGAFPAVRRVRFGLILGSAGFFTLMTGAAPSLVRAFLFIAINETLHLTGRPRKATRVLCLALLVQLVLDPTAIRSVGFQLSYLAMAGIFLLYPPLEAWYPPSPAWDPFRRIWKGAALSLSCQLFTAPLVWHHFHSFPRHFLLTNLLALPLTTLLMGSATLLLALRALGPCPALLIRLTDTLCNGLQWVLGIIAGM